MVAPSGNRKHTTGQIVNSPTVVILPLASRVALVHSYPIDNATQHEATHMALTKTEADSIATLVNTIMVDDIMRTEMRSQRNTDRAWYYMQQGYRHTIELADTYGIELPTLETARDFIKAEEI